MEDLYSILGVQKTATQDEIKSAYRRLAMKYHPDRNPGDQTAEAKFKDINAAYDVLGDETKRRQYDQQGFYGEQQTYSQQYSAWGQQQDDPFWQWANYGRQNGFNGGQRRTYYYEYENPEKDYTRSDWVSQFLKNTGILIVSIFFIRWCWIIIPIGPVLCLAGIVKGFTGALRSLRGIFARNAK